MKQQPKSFSVFIGKKYKLIDYTSQNKKRSHTKKQKINRHFRTKDNKRFISLPYDILYEMFFFLTPAFKLTLDDRRFGDFRKLKLVCRTFYHFYYRYFDRLATKYYLISKYDWTHDPPTQYKWNIRYCPKNIWIDIEKEDGSHKRHKLKTEKQLHVDIDYLKNLKKTLIFMDTETFQTHGKSKCQNCESFTYCETQVYSFFNDTESECRRALQKLVGSTYSEFYFKYRINVCKLCSDYFSTLYKCQKYDALINSIYTSSSSYFNSLRDWLYS